MGQPDSYRFVASDPSTHLIRIVSLSVKVSRAGMMAIHRTKTDLASRRLLVTLVDTRMFEGHNKHSDADLLLEAAGINLDDEQRSAPW